MTASTLMPGPRPTRGQVPTLCLTVSLITPKEVRAEAAPTVGEVARGGVGKVNRDW